MKWKVLFIFLILSFFLALFLNSCATIFTDKAYLMNVHSDIPKTKVIINNTTYETPTQAIVTRSKEKLKIQVLQNDTIVNDTTLNPHLSTEYLFGNICCMGLAGYLIDLTTEKRFSYGKNLYLDSLGKVISVPFYSQKYVDLHFHKYKQGSYNLILAFPHINFFHLTPKDETARNLSGFMGIAIGGEYFYKNNKSLQLRADAIMDFLAPVPAPVDHWGPYESCNAVNINLTDNFHINRFSMGYGLNFARNTWILHGGNVENPDLQAGEEPEFVEGKWETKNMLGLALNAYYRVTNRFYLGIIYRPSFLVLQKNPNFTYEHTISFDFLWKIGK